MEQLSSLATQRCRRMLATCAGVAAALSVSSASAVVQTWQTGAVSDTTRAASAPNAVVDAAGNTTAIWLQRDGTVNRVAVATRGTATKRWSLTTPRQFISKAGESAAGLVSAGNAKGDAVAVWRAGGTIWSARRLGIAGAWSAPAELRTTGQAIGTISVALNDQRDAVVAWIEGTSIWSTFRIGAGSFAMPTKITPTATTRIDHLFTGIDTLGNNYIAWDQMQTGTNGTHMGVFIARRHWLTGAWLRSAKTNLSYDTTVTSLAVRGSGAALMGTQERTGASAKAIVVPYTMTDTAVTAGTAKTFGATGVATSAPVVAMNSAGDAVVAYLSTTNQTAFDLKLASYVKATGTWTTSQTMTTGAAQRGLAVALSFSGLGVASWSDSGSTGRRVRAAVRRSADTPWEAPVTLNSRAGAGDVTTLSERSAHFIATWIDATAATPVANVGLLDTVAPKVTPGFRLVLPVKVPLSLAMRATDALSPIGSYGWTFWDDNTTASGRVVGHQFKRIGTYRITLKAIDAAGNVTRTAVMVRVINSATVKGFPVLGMTLTCPTSIAGAAITWRRGATVLNRRTRHIVVAADLGQTISCIARTTKQSAISPGRLMPKMCRVRNVIGAPKAGARLALLMRGCRVTITTVTAPPAKFGRVVGMSIPAGRLVPNGTLVRLRVGG